MSSLKNSKSSVTSNEPVTQVQQAIQPTVKREGQAISEPGAQPAVSKKRECPVSAGEFTSNATAQTISIGGQQMVAEVKEFSTGSFGWFAGGKIVITVNGKPVTVQVGLNMTVVGSKEAAR